MIIRRRNFLKKVSAGAAAVSAFTSQAFAKPATKPIVVSTWNHGINANAAAWEILKKGGELWMRWRLVFG